jgi:hypothetical protein
LSVNQANYEYLSFETEKLLNMTNSTSASVRPTDTKTGMMRSPSLISDRSSDCTSASSTEKVTGTGVVCVSGERVGVGVAVGVGADGRKGAVATSL